MEKSQNKTVIKRHEKPYRQVSKNWCNYLQRASFVSQLLQMHADL